WAARVVDVDAADAARPRVAALAVLARLIHPAQRRRGELIADEEVAAGVADRAAAAHARAADGGLAQAGGDIGHRLVEAAPLPGVHELRRAGGHAVGHLVAGHVEAGQHLEHAAVAVGHAEAGVVPEGVIVARAVVHAV